MVTNLSHISHTGQQGNKWSIFVGEAVADKEHDSRELKVQLTEQMPFMEGELVEIENEVQVGESSQIKTTNYVTATWFGVFTNRAYPPDIYRGEQILVFNYGDSDLYYWLSGGRDDKMRKTERYRIHIANEQKTVKELSDENTYFFELDTLHNKHVHIQTSDSDGEEFIYMIKLDAKENTIRICDNADNEIVIESELPRVFLRNGDGSFVDINRKNVVLNAVEDLILKAGRQIIEDSPMKTDAQVGKR